MSGPMFASGQSGVTAIARAESGFARCAANAAAGATVGCIATNCAAAPLVGSDGADEPEQPMKLSETTKAAPHFSAAPQASEDLTSRTLLSIEKRSNRISTDECSERLMAYRFSRGRSSEM